MLIEALGICPDVVSEDDGLIDNRAFCLFVLWVTSDG